MGEGREARRVGHLVQASCSVTGFTASKSLASEAFCRADDESGVKRERASSPRPALSEGARGGVQGMSAVQRQNGKQSACAIVHRTSRVHLIKDVFQSLRFIARFYWKTLH